MTFSRRSVEQGLIASGAEQRLIASGGTEVPPVTGYHFQPQT